MPTKTKKTSKKTARRSPRRTVKYDTDNESDGLYLLKLVVLILLGTLWLKFSNPVAWYGIPLTGIPVGLIVGLLCVKGFERFQADRKIWYAVLIVVTIICYFVPAGIVV